MRTHCPVCRSSTEASVNEMDCDSKNKEENIGNLEIPQPASNFSKNSSYRIFSESIDETTPFLNSSFHQKTFEETNEKDGKTELTDPKLRPVSRQQKPRLWQLRASVPSKATTNTKCIASHARGLSNEATGSKADVKNSIPGRPVLVNQKAVCQNNPDPERTPLINEREKHPACDRFPRRTTPGVSGLSVSNAGNGHQLSSVINSIAIPVSSSVGGVIPIDSENTRALYDAKAAVVHRRKSETAATVGAKWSTLDDAEMKKIDEDVFAETDPCPEEVTENFHLVNPPSIWTCSILKNPSRLPSDNVNYVKGVCGFSFDTSMMPGNDSGSSPPGSGRLPDRRPRIGSSIISDHTHNVTACNHGYSRTLSEARNHSRRSSVVQSFGSRPISNVSLQNRRQSAFPYSNRLPPLQFSNSVAHHSRSIDQRRISTPTLADIAFATIAPRTRSPSHQWTMNRTGNLLTSPMPMGDTAPPGTVGHVGGQSSSIIDMLGADHRGAHNPLYDVSNEFMRVTGYTQQFKRLLSKRRSHSHQASASSTGGQPIAHGGASFDLGGDKDVRNMAGLGSSHELHEGTTLAAAAVALGGRRPPSPQCVLDENGAVVGDASFDDQQKLSAMTFTKQRSAYGRLWKEHPNFKHRLRLRKHLFIQRIKVSDFSLLFAIAGIVLTVMEAELTSAAVIEKTEYISTLLRSLIVFTTLILLALVVYYHAIETKIAVIDSGAEDWRVALTYDRIWQCSIEMLVCSICPFPGGSLSVSWDRIDITDHRTTTPVIVPLDAVLSIPMFLRSYLVCRFMALHSRQFQDAATRSIAALNHIAVNFTFVLKTLMHEHPLRVLVLFTVTFWITMSWILTQCERYKAVGEGPEDNHYLNSIWFVIITFMSIGYGDIVPNTYCGRALAITTGIVGAGVSSALIAVISRKLELSRAEKHVNQFMTDSKLTRQRKEAAAAVLQHTWFIHKYKNIPKAKDDTKLRVHQRRFLSAIYEFRRVKWDQRKLAEQGNALVDVAKLQNDMHETLWDMQQNQDHLVVQLGLLIQKVQELQDHILAQNAPHTS